MSSARARSDESSGTLHSPRAFATTQWTLVVRAAGEGEAGSRALEELCRKYWQPLYRFARCRGLSRQDAEDLTQGFFADLLEHGTVARADADRGRFRTFLLSSFVHFHSHQQERAASLKRGGGREIVSLDALREAEASHQAEPLSTDSPEKAFDRKWAVNLVDHAFAALRAEYAALGKAAMFDELKTVVWGGRGETGPAEIARRLNSTEGAVRVAVHRLRKRFRDELRAEVAMTVDDPAEIDDELQYLLAAVGT